MAIILKGRCKIIVSRGTKETVITCITFSEHCPKKRNKGYFDYGCVKKVENKNLVDYPLRGGTGAH